MPGRFAVAGMPATFDNACTSFGDKVGVPGRELLGVGKYGCRDCVTAGKMDAARAGEDISDV
jgi:hypothetical protein